MFAEIRFFLNYYYAKLFFFFFFRQIEMVDWIITVDMDITEVTNLVQINLGVCFRCYLVKFMWLLVELFIVHFQYGFCDIRV